MSRLEQLAERVRRSLHEVLPDGDVRLSGSVLVEGDAAEDLDLVVLVTDVVGAAERVRAAGFPPLYEDEWRGDWAGFREPGPPQVDVVLTRPGSRGDAHHRRAWDALLNDPTLLAEYRALKSDRTDYEARKAAFFERVVASLPPEP